MKRLDNDELHRELSERAEQELLADVAARGQIVRHPWESLDYSSVFSLEMVTGDGREGVFIKVPKADVRRATVFPETPADFEMGHHEHTSLQYLDRHWPAESGTSYVKPLAFYPELNAIVTRRVYAADMFPTWRRLDLLGRVGLAKPDRALQIVRRLGAALSGYHRSSAAAIQATRSVAGVDVVEKICRSIDRLGSLGVDRGLPEQLARIRRVGAGVEVAGGQVATLKGFDLRNVLLARGGDLYLLDPGRLKEDLPAADLARFVTTCRILYWGSPWFFFHLRPAEVYEHAFLAGYGGIPDGMADLYHLYLIKELFKQWVAAYTALDLKRWPSPVSRLVSRTYVGSFYARETRAETGKLADVG